jgi:endonuclease YncB( thermonuclease family)
MHLTLGVRMKSGLSTIAVGLWLAAAAASAATLQGTVTRVIDGDSLVFQPLPAGKPLEVRLAGIDAPEGCQDGGPRAREALADFVLDKKVSLLTEGVDSYGRTLATVKTEEFNINQRMVAEGQAWSIRTKWDKGPYVAQERMSQALKRGLHAVAGAVLPSDFRRLHGPCGAESGPAPLPARSGLSVPPRPAPEMQSAAAPYRCDGRKRCPQMRSCAEATWFLRNCPGMEMDGDNDGIPCESQWCQ